jgi:hypothetical protein
MEAGQATSINHRVSRFSTTGVDGAFTGNTGSNTDKDNNPAHNTEAAAVEADRNGASSVAGAREAGEVQPRGDPIQPAKPS